MNHKYLKSMLTPLVILLAVISANNFRSGVTVAEGKYIDFSLIETKISPTTTLPMESTVVKMNNTSLNGKRKKVVTLQDLMRYDFLAISKQGCIRSSRTWKFICRSNTTEVGTNYKIAKPPRRNDKALRIEKGRGKIYSYYYLGRSVLYFILYYLLFYVLYFTAHIVRSIFLHRVSRSEAKDRRRLNNCWFFFRSRRRQDI